MTETANSSTETPLIRKRTAILVSLVSLAVIVLWLVGTPEGVAGKAIAVGYAICHRIAERSFQIDGVPLPLCARCTGIYLGVMTGLFVATARRRQRVNGLPRVQVILVLLGFIAVMGVDGLNSYIQLFPGVQGVYEPHNWLRLVTGMLCGLGVIHLMLPIFNNVVWRQADRGRILDGWRDLAAVLGVAAVVVIMVLSERPLFLLVLGVISAAGVLVVLTMIGTVLFLTILRRDRLALHWRELRIPMLAGLTLALIEIGAIDVVRFALTQTWNGFVIPR